MALKMKNLKILQYNAITWIITGCVLVLLPIFIWWAQDNISRQKRAIDRLLIEKGATNILLFEVFSRGDMQDSIERASMNRDISHIIITDSKGNIKNHRDSDQIGKKYAKDLDLSSVVNPAQFRPGQFRPDQLLRSRKITGKNGKRVFEVYRRFMPWSIRSMPLRPGRLPQSQRDSRRMMQENPNTDEDPQSLRDRRSIREIMDEDLQIIFLGLDMTSIEAASKEDTRGVYKRGIYLFLIGLAGISLLILFQAYRSAQLSLSRIKALSDNIVENMPIGLVVLDTDSIIASFNFTAETLLNISGEKIIGKPVDEKLPAQFVELVEELKKNNKNIAKELEIDLGEHGKVYLDIHMSILEDNSGTLLGYIILFRDLSEVQELKEEVERSTRLASIGRLAAGVAHEIRNPLSSIKGFATYFGERYRDIPEDKDTAGIMVNEVERLNRVISQLLEFARPLDIKKEAVDIKTIINHSAKMIERDAAEKEIKVRVDIPPEIPQIDIDSDRINQVFLNLFLNSIEAMDSGGELSVTVKYKAKSELMKITVADTGKGINPDELGNIFDPYFTTKQSGTGLGLAIVHRIIESHNGEIKVESTPGKGTIVNIALPLV
jgi:two-component system sensor histidine kinase HydH